HEALERCDHRGSLLGRRRGGDDLQPGAAVDHGAQGIVARPMPELPLLSEEAVLAAVSPAAAIERVQEAFVRHHAGEWTMPAKVYLPSPPHGDFRAMPARGDGLALLKWVTSFPGNPARGLPTVTGVICLSDATSGEPLMLLDARSVTALRTGAVAAVAAQALARRTRATSGSSDVASTEPGRRGAWSRRATAQVSVTTPTTRLR